MFSKRFQPAIAYICLTLLSALAFCPAGLRVHAQAEPPRGLPDSTEFGYGGRLDPWGEQADLALNVASGIGFDWIAIDFDWNSLWPEALGVMDMTLLDATLEQANQYHLHVLISISHAPDWAMTANGPDAAKTAMLLMLLANRYPDALLAVELFPAANTLKGWGAPPNPGAYARLLQSIQQAVQDQANPVVIIAAGLTPLELTNSADDMDDLAYLRGLYEAGARAYMPVISLRLTGISTDPMQAASSQPRVLRHYESVRQVMVENQHEIGLIWITGYTWPDAIQNGPIAGQTRWLNQALLLMKSQLYIGAAFFDQINPPSEHPSQTPTLILRGNNTSLHPALTTFGQIITLERTGQDTGVQIFLTKKMVAGPGKNSWKGN